MKLIYSNKSPNVAAASLAGRLITSKISVKDILLEDDLTVISWGLSCARPVIIPVRKFGGVSHWAFECLH
jgi:hypothetical protein